MDRTLKRVMDRFFKNERCAEWGLGLPMLAQAARSTGGSFEIESQ